MYYLHAVLFIQDVAKAMSDITNSNVSALWYIVVGLLTVLNSIFVWLLKKYVQRIDKIERENDALKTLYSVLNGRVESNQKLIEQKVEDSNKRIMDRMDYIADSITELKQKK